MDFIPPLIAIKDLQDTSVPFILCITGIVFITFWVTGGIGQHGISRGSQIIYAITGSFFLIGGTYIFFQPTSNQTVTQTIKNLQSSSISFILVTGLVVFIFYAIAKQPEKTQYNGNGGLPHKYELPGCKRKVSWGLSVLFLTILFVLYFSPTILIKYETITILFNKYNGQIQSSQSYNGTIDIKITGTGQYPQNHWSDAFYIFTDSAGKQIQPVPFRRDQTESPLLFNDIPIEQIFTPSGPSPTHMYEFKYPLPGGSQKLSFGLRGNYSKVSTGWYTIEITYST